MRISLLLLLAFSCVYSVVADKLDGCQILQTTDPRTPCYILIKQAPDGVPPFVYMLNLPRSTPQTPCPVSQTLDASFSCYVSPTRDDDPAFILNVPLPPGADEIDESPSGKAKLRQAKANPIFRKVEPPSDFGKGQPTLLPQQIGPSQPFRQIQTPTFSAAKSLPQYYRQPEPVRPAPPLGQAQPVAHISPQQTGLSQPTFPSPFELPPSRRLPQPIGLTKSIGLTQPIGPPSPQLTKALFKPLTPSLPQVQPPSPQNQFIFRTVPTLFQPQLTRQAAPKFPRTQSFHHTIQYQNQQPLYYTSFTQSTQEDSFPYPSSQGSGSISAFEGPYPPSV